MSDVRKAGYSAAWELMHGSPYDASCNAFIWRVVDKALHAAEAGRQSASGDLAEIGDRLAAALGVTEGNPMALTAKAVEALSVLSGQQGVLVPRDLAERLLECAEEATWMGGVYHIQSAALVTELRALLSGSVAEEADRG